jgi:hypothetical protein
MYGRPAGSGGGRPPPGGAFIHHNFRYGPEPPAYKTPRPEYTSYVRKEPERPPPQDRHVVERSFDDRLFEQFMRKFWKEQAEEETLDPDDVELDDDGPDLSGAPDIANVIIRKPSEIPKEPPSRIEFEPLLPSAKRQESKAEFDPEQLLKGLEAYPTEELQEKTLTELNNEPKFNEEDVEGCEVETNTLPSRGMLVEQTLDQYMPSEESTEVKQTEASAELEPYTIESRENVAAVETEAAAQPLEVEPAISEVELLSDVQDLMHELEPEIEEQEEVELSHEV